MGNLLPGISGDVLGRLRIFICQFFIVSAAASSHHPRAPVLHEQMDRDSLLPVPGARLFGFPPIYYQTTTDFSVASAIVVKGKETAQANLTVARRGYYPVRIPVGIPVRNATAVAPMNLVVHPMGHWGPGWSLGYNPMEQTIEGMHC